MRSNIKQIVYISDYLAVPMPAHATSSEQYLRKVRNRRRLWALLPVCVEIVGSMLLVLLLVFGISVCAVGIGAV